MEAWQAKLLVAFAWMEGFREGAQAASHNAPEAHEKAFRRAGGINRMVVAVDEVVDHADSDTETHADRR